TRAASGPYRSSASTRPSPVTNARRRFVVVCRTADDPASGRAPWIASVPTPGGLNGCTMLSSFSDRLTGLAPLANRTSREAGGRGSRGGGGNHLAGSPLGFPWRSGPVSFFLWWQGLDSRGGLHVALLRRHADSLAPGEVPEPCLPAVGVDHLGIDG